MITKYYICFILLFYKVYAEIQTTGYSICSKYLEKNNTLCQDKNIKKGYILEPSTGCLLKLPGTINNTLFYNNCENPKCFNNNFLKYYYTGNYNYLTPDACIGANYPYNR